MKPATSPIAMARLKMSKRVKSVFGGILLLAGGACASNNTETTKEQTIEPYSKTEAEPDGYTDPCFDRKKAKKTPGCLAYEPKS